MDAVLSALSGHRFPLEDEKATQAAMHEALGTAFGQGVQREVRIMGGIVDFWITDLSSAAAAQAGSIGVEVKLKGSARDIVRQVRGYCWEPALAGLVLATAKPVHLGPTLAGKPVAVLDLGRAWL